MMVCGLIVMVSVLTFWGEVCLFPFMMVSGLVVMVVSELTFWWEMCLFPLMAICGLVVMVIFELISGFQRIWTGALLELTAQACCEAIASHTTASQCIENYTGARCEEVFLPSSSIQTKSNLFAAFVVMVVLLITLIIGALYFLCRKGHLQRASSVQYDINLVETSHTSAYHSHGEH
nr:pro-neuregulin-4, membrane-bound isoform isoform X2 [Microcebus murinus]